MSSTNQIASINVALRIAIDDGGVIWPITDFLDDDGDLVDDPMEAVSAVAGAGDIWFSFRFADFELARRQ